MDRTRSLTRSSIAIFIFVLMTYVAINLDAQNSLTGRPTIDLLLLAGLANIVAYCFVRTNRSWSKFKQIAIIAFVLLAQITIYSAIRLDGLYGNGYPRLAWRWTTKPSGQMFDYENNSAIKVDSDASSSWPGFRGRNCSGIFAEAELRNWNQFPPKLIWSRSVGSGWSSFAIAGNVCITHEQRKNHEVLSCYELSSGRPVWVNRQEAHFDEISSGEGPRATPSIKGKFVYSFGATGILSCVKIESGKTQWSRNVLEENQLENRIFGMTGSPLVVDDKVLVVAGGSRCSVIAYNRFTGLPVWSSGNEMASYASLQSETICGTDAVLSFNGEGLSCYQLVDGTPMFHIPWISNPEERNNVCQPIVLTNSESSTRIFISSGYGKGCAVYEISSSNEELSVSKLWSNNNLKSKFSSAVYHDKYVYGLDNGILTCVHTETGQRSWKRGRYGHGQIIRIGKSIVIQSEGGDIAKVDCSPQEWIEEAKVEGLSSKTWNHPAFDGKHLIIRNDRQAICFELGSKNQQ
ncbi:MAG: PQQ-binding-like beta-propeller repeat protein [Planctomycetota bacterium]